MRDYKDSGQLLARRNVQMFQYKYYHEQAPLNLDKTQMDMVIDAVVNPPKGDHETRLLASKILIKLLVDIYCGRNDDTTPRCDSVTVAPYIMVYVLFSINRCALCHRTTRLLVPVSFQWSHVYDTAYSTFCSA